MARLLEVSKTGSPHTLPWPQNVCHNEPLLLDAHSHHLPDEEFVILTLRLPGRVELHGIRRDTEEEGGLCELDVGLSDAAEPFINWLKEAEEDSDDSDEE